MRNAVLLVLGVFLLVSCGSEIQQKVNFNDGWEFKQLEDSDIPEKEYQLTECNEIKWEKVSLPHTANLEPLIVNNQWQGNCWYRKHFNLPDAYANKKIIIELEAAMNYSKVWINGVPVTEHHGGYLPVVFDITKYVKIGDDNMIAIRLNNQDNSITGPKPLKILDFNMYGGLYRNAWLIIKDKVHITNPVLANKTASGGVFITTPKVSKKESMVEIKTHLQNDYRKNTQVEIIHSIYFRDKLVQEEKLEPFNLPAQHDIEKKAQVIIHNANLWSPKEPNLYTLKTSVYIEGEQVDEQVTRFGIREMIFKGNALYVNGEQTFLRGVNRHQEYPFVGYALSDNAQYRDAKKIKDAGFNCIRLSHYPHSPAFMDACDELGILVIDAILGWQFYKDNDLFREYCYRSAKELILRDRNHPSVLSWEVSLNETKMPVFFMEELHKIVHEEYPAPCTYSCGWMNDVYDIFLQARQHRIMHHFDSIQPKPYFVSEYGDWEYYSMNAGLNQHLHSRDLRMELSSRQARSAGEKGMLQQAYNLQEAHNDNLNTPAFGDGYWVMFDYNRGYHDDIERSGIMDICRLPKFSYYFYQSQRAPEEGHVLKIASYWNESSDLNIKVYGNCETVELLLNGRSIAKQAPDNDSNSNNLSHPPFSFALGAFEAGELKAIGYIGNKKVSEHVVVTPGKPTGLKIWIDESGKAPEAGCNDVIFVYIAQVDKYGTVIPQFNEEVQVDINGDAEIMNVGEIKAEAGIATTLVRIGQDDGEISINATSGSLAKEIVVEVN